MWLHFYGHSTFGLTAANGEVILIDPYSASERFLYEPRFDRADIVLVTHEHGDHNNTAAVPGEPQIVRGSNVQRVNGIPFTGIPSYHDRVQGAERGPNTIFVFDLDGIRIAHLGDQGAELDERQYAQLAGVNVLIAPVGGRATLEPEEIWALTARVRPNIMIPMHFKTEKC